MSASAVTLLTDRAVIAIEGGDAASFLHRLVTSSVEDLAHGIAQPAALLSPQGKVLFEFLIAHTDNGMLIDCAADRVAELLKRLTMYKLRADVRFTDLSAAWQVVAVARSPGATPGSPMQFKDGRSAAMPDRLYLSRSDAQQHTVGFPIFDYHAQRIAAGIPECGHDYAFGEVFPHEALLDQFGGIDFQKGCYIGQEVVSRMQHRGTARSRFVIVECDVGLPERGTEIVAGTTPLGVMGSHAGHMGLGLIRLDRLEQAITAGHPVMAGAAPVKPRKPPFAHFDVPGAPP
jgi:tRNA-modifying protein YgfZ